jgi:2'-hydroxyisoflavone reductase
MSAPNARMRLLVIGGTYFMGRSVVETAAERGHEVTVFHRGAAEPEGYPPVEHVHGDRDGGLGALAGRTWDALLDTCGFFPRQVEEVADTLAGSVGTYGFVSSISVYPDDAPDHADERTTTHEPLTDGTEEITELTYGPLKVACERAAMDRFAGRCLIVRPGYIVGPHDPSDRFTYWVRRAARGGTMLAPEPGAQPLQAVDARDLATFALDRLEAGDADTYHVVGPADPLTWADALPVLVDTAGAGTELAWVAEDYLRERLGEDVYEALPLWDVELPSLHRIDASKARSAGLRLRPLAETVADTLAWDRSRGVEALKVGLTAAREAELLAGG